MMLIYFNTSNFIKQQANEKISLNKKIHRKKIYEFFKFFHKLTHILHIFPSREKNSLKNKNTIKKPFKKPRESLTSASNWITSKSNRLSARANIKNHIAVNPHTYTLPRKSYHVMRKSQCTSISWESMLIIHEFIFY